MNRALLASEREGVVETILVGVGERVKQGQLLVELRHQVAEALYDLREFEARNDIGLRLARLLASSLKSDYEAAVDLENRNAMSSQEVRLRQREYDRAVLTLEQREYELRLAEMESTRARADLDAYSVTAPFSGIVTRLMKTRGESVQDGEAILELVNPDIVHVEGYGRLRDFWNAGTGTRVRVQLDAPELAEFSVSDVSCDGELILVDPLVQPVTQRIRVVAEVRNDDNVLRDGLKARMAIDLTPRTR